MMLYAPDPNAEAEALATRGLEVMPLMQDAGGRDIHPKNTHGVLIRIYSSAMAADLDRELDQGLGPMSMRESRAHLTGIRRVILAVRTSRMRWPFIATVSAFRRDYRANNRRGVCESPCADRRAAAGSSSRLRSTIAAVSGEATAFLGERGEGMYALVLESADLDATVTCCAPKESPCGNSPPIRHSGPPRSTARVSVSNLAPRLEAPLAPLRLHSPHGSGRLRCRPLGSRTATRCTLRAECESCFLQAPCCRRSEFQLNQIMTKSRKDPGAWPREHEEANY